MAVAEIVRFDEHENPFTLGTDSLVSRPRLQATSSTSSSNPSYPAMVSSDPGGWFYLNLNNGGSTTYSATHGGLAPIGSTTTVGPRPSQNWVTVTMFGNVGGNRLTAEFDAASLGNGCSPAAFPSSAVPIGPAGGVFVCPPGTTLTSSTAQSTNTSAVTRSPHGCRAEKASREKHGASLVDRQRRQLRHQSRPRRDAAAAVLRGRSVRHVRTDDALHRHECHALSADRARHALDRLRLSGADLQPVPRRLRRAGHQPGRRPHTKYDRVVERHHTGIDLACSQP